MRSGKHLVFTQYADTARYLYENLNPGRKRDDVDVIFSGDKSKARAVGRFAPKANPEYRFQPSESELSTLIATDVLAEGLNMQDCDKIVNYDLHWNPVRLIQRFGRIDRIGSKHGEIFGFNFLPETGIEENLGLGEILRHRIREVQATIGEDAAILEPGEKLNEDVMYAIYEKDEGAFEGYEEDFTDLGEVVELFRLLREEDPEEFERISSLRDGIRAGKSSREKGLYVFCRSGGYRQLYLLDVNGEVKSRDLRHILRAISCGREEDGIPLPAGYNAAVMRVKERFEREIRERRAERESRRSRNRGQRYVRRELQVLFAGTEDAAVRERINALERPVRGTAHRRRRAPPGPVAEAGYQRRRPAPGAGGDLHPLQDVRDCAPLEYPPQRRRHAPHRVQRSPYLIQSSPVRPTPSGDPANQRASERPRRTVRSSSANCPVARRWHRARRC